MLARLLDEQLDEADHASIVDHVESCVSCQERLKELTSDDSRLFEWKQIDRSATNPWLTSAHAGTSSQSHPLPNPGFHWDSPRAARAIRQWITTNWSLRITTTNGDQTRTALTPCRWSKATRFWRNSVTAAWASSTRPTSSV